MKTTKTNLLLLSVLGFSTLCSKGDYSLQWSTIGSGDRLERAGAYVLNGTVGQADAGNAAGGNYTLMSGFWSGFDATSDDFRLTIHANKKIVLLWPAKYGDCILQTKTSLSSGSWVDVASTPTIIGDQCQVTTPKTSGSQFFRLRRP